MQKSQINYECFVGFDVSKDFITCYNSLSEQTDEIKNTVSSLTKYIKNLDINCLAICEPTGGYEAILLDVLAKFKVPTHRCDSCKVKSYIRSLGIYAKTDAIDAKALASYGMERHIKLDLWSIPSQLKQELQMLITRRQELVSMHTAEINRSKAPLIVNKNASFVKQSHVEMLKAIKQQLHQVKALIVKLIEQDQHLSDINKILQSFVGIGEISACGLIATLPELGKISRRQIASLVGLAPHPKQSGRRDGYRSVSGGRAQVKKILFIVAMVAVRRNIKIKEFYDRLIQNGKKKLVALTAVMRKIITILNAQIRDYYKIKQMS